MCHEGAVYAFTGASGAGKSTLAAALAAQGLPLFCDDTMVLDLSDPDSIVCLPGHKRLKLTPEALELTGAAGEEQVAQTIGKFYSRPAALYQGEPLPLRQLVFLEEGEEAAITGIAGAERLTRLADDHYTARHFSAARQFDHRAWFAHASRLARQIGMSRFVRPRDPARFAAGVDLAHRWIVGRDQAARPA